MDPNIQETRIDPFLEFDRFVCAENGRDDVIQARPPEPVFVDGHVESPGGSVKKSKRLLEEEHPSWLPEDWRQEFRMRTSGATALCPDRIISRDSFVILKKAKRKGDFSRVDFDFRNSPHNVSWTLTSAAHDIWTPSGEEGLTPEPVKKTWDDMMKKTISKYDQECEIVGARNINKEFNEVRISGPGWLVEDDLVQAETINFLHDDATDSSSDEEELISKKPLNSQRVKRFVLEAKVQESLLGINHFQESEIHGDLLREKMVFENGGSEINAELLRKKMVLNNGGSEINGELMRKKTVFENGGIGSNGELLRKKMVFKNGGNELDGKKLGVKKKFIGVRQRPWGKWVAEIREFK
ncbi:hypothetical protein Leryth_014749 [Lithospermum erythrorhizon]|nr:hypothetical protein Leryth_014749 [Lithospermum erythrorhizon]